MQLISLDEIKNKIDLELESQKISGKVLLDRFCVIEDGSRKTSAYVDHTYAPFYYYLGKYFPAKSLAEIGFTLGLLSSSFMLSCKSVENFFGFKEKIPEFVSTRIGKININKVFKKNKNFYSGELYDQEFLDFSKNLWDVVLIGEEKKYDKQLEYMELMWPQVSDSGIIIVEYMNKNPPSKEAFDSFCDNKKLKPYIFKTRYGTGIIQKI